ncbi:MAG TPA: helix-turn-helix transcriptional regulator [Desulfosporosinus sp.]|nr:helix-turn-helix transcriptional regulator [Desulfosporosinus sp.]
MSGKEGISTGKIMREARLRATIGSQKELAEKVGISATIISDLERGKRPMSPTWARKIAQVVGLSWTDLMD